jgi:hypothetical protein
LGILPIAGSDVVRLAWQAAPQALQQFVPVRDLNEPFTQTGNMRVL